MSIDTEKTHGKFHYAFIIKTLSKLGLEGDFFNFVKTTTENL